LLQDGERTIEPLSLENTVWNNTVLASGTIIGLVVYTGSETRSVMNTTKPETKHGTLDYEINYLAILLGILLLIICFVMVAGNLFYGLWYIDFLRYIVLFSFVVPISMSVNLDMAKLVYVFFIMNDNKIDGTIVRNTGVPEELGRISYLMSDKTGTLTQNGSCSTSLTPSPHPSLTGWLAHMLGVDMEFKKLCLGDVTFSGDSIDELRLLLEQSQEFEIDGQRTRGYRIEPSLSIDLSRGTLTMGSIEQRDTPRSSARSLHESARPSRRWPCATT